MKTESQSQPSSQPAAAASAGAIAEIFTNKYSTIHTAQRGESPLNGDKTIRKSGYHGYHGYQYAVSCSVWPITMLPDFNIAVESDEIWSIMTWAAF